MSTEPETAPETVAARASSETGTIETSSTREPTVEPTARSYADFIAAKMRMVKSKGLDEVPYLSHLLKPFQTELTEWALRAARTALFAGCGLGKSWMGIEWARVVSEHTEKPVLIVTPLAVARQFVREGVKLGVDVIHLREPEPGGYHPAVYVCNYERLDKILAEMPELGGVVLDESSILKSFDGKTRTKLIELFRHVAFKLCLTATPSPNDATELGNHAEFLGVMRHVDMLNRFFAHDGSDVSKWALKGHARIPYWRWVTSWARVVSKPSDMGHSDEGYDLPPLYQYNHVVGDDLAASAEQGQLFAYEATTLTEQRASRRATMSHRVAAVASLVNASTEQWLVFCDLNDESDALAKAIPDGVVVTGSDKAEHKEQSILDHIDGKVRVLISKASIIGFGINAQHCRHQAHAGVGHSFESFYQAVRRSWRFGQTQPVHINVFHSAADAPIVRNLTRKQGEFDGMVRDMVRVMLEESA